MPSTQTLSPQNLLELINAAAYAEHITKPLNIPLDISWSYRTEGPKPHDALRDFLKRAREWLRRRDETLCFIWAMENPLGPIGLHTHLCLHLPPDLYPAFRQAAPRWIEGYQEEYPDRRILNWGQVSQNGSRQKPTLMDSQAQRWGRLQYLFKGIGNQKRLKAPDGSSHRIATLLNLTRAKESQGLIEGKRVGVSHSLGLAARSKADWSEITDPRALATMALERSLAT